MKAKDYNDAQFLVREDVHEAENYKDNFIAPVDGRDKEKF